MAYTVYSGERCVRVAFDNGRCALTDGHHGLHTTAAGGRFSTQCGKYLSGDPLRRPTAGQKVTVENVSESVAAVLEQRIDVLREATLMNVEQLSERIRILEQGIDAVDTALVDMRTDLNREKKAREALTVELVNTRRSRLSPLEDRVVKLELPYGHVQAVKDTHNALVERIERIERDLRDTHDLAERAATAHLERKPEQWNADSAEPPHDQLYVDTDGAVWKHNDSGWHGCAPSCLDWALDEGWQWHELTSGRNDDPTGITPAPDFPWKVWTNG